jgi:hypothetical protein
VLANKAWEVSKTDLGFPVDPEVVTTKQTRGSTSVSTIGAVESAGPSPLRECSNASSNCGVDHEVSMVRTFRFTAETITTVGYAI